MAQSWLALLVALVGVVGTLSAALVTQVRADRVKRLEIDTLRGQHAEDRAHAERMRTLELADAHEQRAEARQAEARARLRACYVAFNAAARQYQTAQVNVVHALRAGTDVTVSEYVLSALEEARTVFRASYAEAQMQLPGPVLAAASAVSRRLNDHYGVLKKSLAETPRAPVPPDCEQRVQSAWVVLTELRRTMRRDLRIDDAAP
ncbi:hypothetical protein [Streptomyces prunicolor]